MTRPRKTTVQLIAYVDRLGEGTLSDLSDLYKSELSDLFPGLHILPFYWAIDGADAGYDPIDHQLVDHRLGTWDSVNQIAGQGELMVDLIVNHISSKSQQFRDYLEKGEASSYASMFGLVSRLFPEEVDKNAMSKVSHPGGGSPLHDVVTKNGLRTQWSSFSKDQIDIDVESDAGWTYLNKILDQLAQAGVQKVRLDAVGYTVKTPGTSCFMTQGTHEFIRRLADAVRARGMSSVLEIHGHHRHILSGAEVGDYVYDFCLPPLVLHALSSADAMPLVTWLNQSPPNCITVLDTHDGIGVQDVAADPLDNSFGGLLSDSQIEAVVETIHKNSGGVSQRASGHTAQNLDVTQINCTFFDALGRDDEAYILARLIQVFAPGIPQIYYAGWLALKNDTALLDRTGVGRDVNRPYCREAVIKAERKKTVVQALEHLILFRNSFPAFQGDCRFELVDKDKFVMLRRAGAYWAKLSVELSSIDYSLSWGDGHHEQETRTVHDLPIPLDRL